MSLAGAEGSEVALVSSASETARFGHSVERMSVGDDWRHAFTRLGLSERLKELLDASDAQTIILRYPSDSAFVVKDLGAHGRSLFPAGSLLYWEHVGRTPPRPADVRVLQSPGIDPGSLSEIQSLIADSFSNYKNHYAVNPLLDEAAVTEGYLEWAEATALAADNRVFVVSAGGKAVGVATVECPPDSLYWEVQLAGIVTSAQGEGVYSRLMTAVVATAHSAGVKRVVISTQAHNIRVQRAWTRLGFVPFGSIETVHLVRPDS